MQRQGKQRSSSGPALPSKLSKEIGAGNSEAGPRNERVSKAFALADRKAQRKAKRKQKGQQRLRFTQNLPQDSSSARPPGKASKKRQLGSGQEVWSQHAKTSSAASRLSYWFLMQAAKPPAKRVKKHVHSTTKDKPPVTGVANTSKINQKTAKRSGKPAHKGSKFDELVQGESLQVCFPD